MNEKEMTSNPRPEIISVECNLEEFPFTCVALKNLKKLKEYHYERWIKDYSTNKSLKQEWTMIAAPNNHLPGPFDLDVKRALDKIVFQTGIENVVQVRKISFSIYQIVEILGLKMGGTTYKNIKESLERLHATRYTSKNAFFLKNTKQYVGDSFFLIERLNMKEAIDASSTRTKVTVYFGSYYLESLKSYYVKPFDFGFYLSLKNPIRKRLYGILDKRSFSSKTIIYDLIELGKVIPLSNRSPSKIRQVITPSFEELKRRGYLSDFNFYTENKVHIIEIKVRGTNPKKTKLSEEDQFFVDEIIRQTGDSNSQSKKYYEKVCKTVDRNLIYRALSEVKEEDHLGEIKKSKGALFTTKIKRYLKEMQNH
ncbi:MAG: replication initiator protein A [Nitrospira sp.]